MRLFLILLCALGLIGCASQSISDFQGTSPEFDLQAYFLGKTQATGIFEDRFGRLRREFIVDIDGYMEGETLILDEQFFYKDGEEAERIWRIDQLNTGLYEGRADDIVGAATGKLSGNALNWVYVMDLKVGGDVWRVKFDDWMYLQDGGILINRAYVRRWGFLIGTVTLVFQQKEVNPTGAAQ